VRVLLVSHYNPDAFEYGGLATFVRELSRGLRELGHEVHYVAVSPTATRRYRNVRLVPSGFSPEELDYRLHEVVRLCAELDGLYDVIVANDYFSPCVARESRLVAYVHTYAGSPWELLLFSYADRLCTNSKLSKSAFEEHARFVRQLTSPWTGKPPVEVEVLYPPPPEPPGRAVVPEGLPELGDTVLCFMGRMQEHKNFEAFRGLVLRLGADGLVVSHDAESRVEVYGESRIVYVGNAPEEVKWGLMGRCTLGVVPSLYEPYGLVALEFVRAGVPVVVSRNCGVAEVLEPLTFDPLNPREMEEVVKEALRFRDDYLAELQDRPIMRKTWAEFAEELLRF